jgi:hypothetical protein
MRTSFLLLLLILTSCSAEQPPVTDDSFLGIGILGYREHVPSGRAYTIEIPTFNLFIFMYHDSIFQIEIDTLGKSTCYLMKYSYKTQSRADGIFQRIRNGNFRIPLKEYQSSCFPDLVYLSNKKEKTEFYGLPFHPAIRFLLSDKFKRIKIPASQQPEIFKAKMYEFDSRYLRHYFSDDYFYKDFRVTSRRAFKFLPAT